MAHLSQIVQSVVNETRAMRKESVRVARRMGRAAKAAYAPFAVVDDYGTDIRCWTFDEALTWLPSCSSNASIFVCHSVAWKLVATRHAVAA